MRIELTKGVSVIKDECIPLININILQDLIIISLLQIYKIFML